VLPPGEHCWIIGLLNLQYYTYRNIHTCILYPSKCRDFHSPQDTNDCTLGHTSRPIHKISSKSVNKFRVILQTQTDRQKDNHGWKHNHIPSAQVTWQHRRPIQRTYLCYNQLQSHANCTDIQAREWKGSEINTSTSVASWQEVGGGNSPKFQPVWKIFSACQKICFQKIQNLVTEFPRFPQIEILSTNNPKSSCLSENCNFLPPQLFQPTTPLGVLTQIGYSEDAKPNDIVDLTDVLMTIYHRDMLPSARLT